MGQKDEMIEMARLVSPSRMRARLEMMQREMMEKMLGRTRWTGRKRDHFLCRASRCQQSSNSTARRVLSCLYQMGICLGPENDMDIG
jgi:hypothetical protein